METTQYNDVTLSQLRHTAGGMSASSGNFLICKDFHWDNSTVGNAYRTDASAVVLCRKGSIRVRTNMTDRYMDEGCLMLYGPKSIVTILEKTEDATIDIIFLSIHFLKETQLNMELVMPIYKYISDDENGMLKLDPDECDIIGQYFTLLRDSMQFKQAQILKEIVAAMFRTVSELYSRRVVSTDSQLPKTRQQDYFERFVKQVSMFYREQRSVQFYADALYITPKYLSTIIKELSGRSAAEWINDFVIQEAKMMLRFSNKSIQEIAYALNFSTQSFFGKYFKRHTGVSPSQYRAHKND